MPTTAHARRLADVALAPLVWLERARGRWRLALATVYLLILAVVAALTWRSFSLWGLPDVGEPFDVAAFQTCDVPDDENAFVLYEQAAARFRRPKDPHTGQPDTWIPEHVLNSRYGASSDPTYLDRKQRIWLDVNRDALALWRRGTERTKACPRNPTEPIRPEGWSIGDALTQLSALGLLRAERLTASGDVAEAWGWYNAALRCNRHLPARGLASRQFTANHLFHIRMFVKSWANNPAVDPALLRRALEDVVAAEALTPPEADAIKAYYLDVRDELGKGRTRWVEDARAAETGLLPHLVFEADLRWFFKREPERSLRVARIAFANWLAHSELDRHATPAVDTGRLAFWSLGPDAPAPARALGPGEFARWSASTLLLDRMPTNPMSAVETTFRVDRAWCAETILLLAARLYTIERGRPPASDQDLIGPYLKRPPDGYADLWGTTANKPARPKPTSSSKSAK